MKSSASESKPFQSRSKGEIPGRARRKERLSRSKLKQAFLIDSDAELFIYLYIELFRERLSEKVHATIPKGIVGGFEFSVLQRNLKEMARKAIEMCFLVLKESNKSRSTATDVGTVY